MSPNPAAASSSCRLLSSAASRLSSRAARSVCARLTTAPQCGSSASGSSAPLPQSIPYRCTSAGLCASARAPAIARSSCDRPDRGAPAAIRWVKESRARTADCCCWIVGRSTSPNTHAGAPPAGRSCPGERRHYVAQEQARRERRQPRAVRVLDTQPAGGAADLLDQDREVGDLRFADARARPGRAGSGLPSLDQSTGATHGPGGSRRAGARPPCRRPARPGTGRARHGRAGRRPGPGWTGRWSRRPGRRSRRRCRPGR